MQIAEKDFTLVIFGASGSLAKLKIFPAIYQLALEGRLQQVNYKIVGYARSAMSEADFRKVFADAVTEASEMVDEKVLESVLEHVSYFQGEYENEQDYTKLANYLVELEAGKKDVARIVYFSVPPAVFPAIIKNIGAKLDNESNPVRLILEKPFGYDLSSAKELREHLKLYNEEQLYLLDHYLGKEAVFNVLSLRYANSILTTLIKGKHIANIQITGFEPVGIEQRAGYFDHVGIFRDMIQSHLLQILAFLTMSLPMEINAETLMREKRHVFEDIKVVDPERFVVRGQYTAGVVDNEKVPGYLEEEGVAQDSQTETFAAVRLMIDNLRWHNVPIYLRSGKRVGQKWTAIVIEFKKHSLHQGEDDELDTNKLLIQLQPMEKIEFTLFTKVGGTDIAFREMTTGRPIYCSGDCLHEHGRLLLEVIRGNRLLFLSFEEVFAAWKVVDPIIEAFRTNKTPLYKYQAGTWGPKEADKLPREDGFEWNDFF